MPNALYITGVLCFLLQLATAAMDKIDTHSHIVPPVWRKYCLEYGFDKPDGMPGIPEWSIEEHLAMMDHTGISKSVVSITSPGTHLVPGNDTLARQVTRETNDEIAQLVSQRPDRFEFFASLPLPDVEGSIAEIDYALDKLGAKGFALLTNAHGVYLGDEALDPVFKKLNERHALIFMHPTVGCGNDPTALKPLNQYSSPMLEFFFDTTRAVTNLLLSGTVDRYPNIRYIVSHTGAVIPPLLERFTGFSKVVKMPYSLTSAEAKELFKTRFYFDLTGFPFPDQIHGYLRISNSSRLVYGSDWPYTPIAILDTQREAMEKGLAELFDEKTIDGIYAAHATGILCSASEHKDKL
ncbi:Decarboxylase yanB [Cladobotryum mycophilum]|uniref:6-methylsalicylate decarboxylase n=1 Tax=Cladobotryum mycophilum TaxID=491253 RepID=A0ABR0SGR3_9HYPO